MLQGEREMAQLQQDARQVPARGHPAGAARRAAGRGHIRHRRQRHPVGVREGHGHRQRAEDRDQGRLGSRRRRDPAHGARRRGARRRRPRLRDLADARNSAESRDYTTEKSLAEHGERLDEVTAHRSPRHDRAPRGARVLDADEIRRSRGATEASYKLAEALYQQQPGGERRPRGRRDADGDEARGRGRRRRRGGRRGRPRAVVTR